MKLLIVLFVYLCGMVFSVYSQTTNDSSFLFEEYQDALIFYKDGRQFQAPVTLTY